MSVIRLLTPSGNNLARHLESLSVDMAWGAPLTWKATFRHHTNGLLTMPSPLLPPGTGAFANEILPHDFDMSRYLDLYVHQAGETVRFPRLLPGDPSHDGTTLSWGGTDLTPMLEQDAQPMTDILLDGGGVQRFAGAAMQEIASAFDVVARYEGTDYQIRELRRGSGGTAIGWMRAIAEPYQCAPSWRGDNQIVWAPANFDADQDVADWTFIDRLSIETGDLQCNAEGVKNYLTVARLEPQSRVLGEQVCRSPEVCTGRTGSITLSRPCQSIVVIGRGVNGFLSNCTAFDESNNVTDFRAILGPMVGSRPIARIEFTFQHTPTSAPVALGYQVEVYGGGQPRDEAFSWTVSSAPSIAEIGERREIRALEASIVTRAADGQGMANAVLDERIRRTWQLPMSTPFSNPLIRPGDRVRITDWLTGGSRVWFVQSVSWVWTRGAADRMQLVGIRPWL